MEDILFFINNFIQKDRQARWREFLEKGWDVFFSKLRQVERHLNDKCTLIENNATETMVEYARKHKISSGFYYDAWTQGQEVYFPHFETSDNSFIVNRNGKCAFYVHPEGWIWICAANRDPYAD